MSKDSTTFTRRNALIGGAAMVAAPMVIGRAHAAAEVTWKVQSHWPKASASFGESLAIIAAELEENTGGRMKLELFGAGEFAKGGEIAAMQRESDGGLRMLCNLIDAEPMWAKVNNATPRLLTVSNSLVRERPDMVVRYARTLLQSARWAEQNRAEAVPCLARETGVTPEDIETYYIDDLHMKLRPSLEARLVDALEVMKDFLFEHGFIDRNFSTEQWMAKDLLREAYDAEGLEWRD